jgi:hypothetical protein
MIGQAKAISHGVNLISYISGETTNKKHPEEIHHVETRFLPEGLDVQGIVCHWWHVYSALYIKPVPFVR